MSKVIKLFIRYLLEGFREFHTVCKETFIPQKPYGPWQGKRYNLASDFSIAAKNIKRKHD